MLAACRANNSLCSAVVLVPACKARHGCVSRALRARSGPAPARGGGWRAPPSARGAGRHVPAWRASQLPSAATSFRDAIVRPREPVVRRFRQSRIRPVVAPVLRRRIDDAGDVAGRAQHERRCRRPGAASIGTPSATARCDRRARRRCRPASSTRARSIGSPAIVSAPRLAQLVVEIHVPQVVGVHRARQVRRIAVPVQEVERRRRLALQVVADDVVPDELVGAQARERAGELAAVHALARHAAPARARRANSRET